MTLSKIMKMGLVKDSTTIYIRGYGAFGMVVLACGNWFQDNILILRGGLNNEKV